MLSLFCWQGYRDEYAATLLPSFVNLPLANSCRGFPRVGNGNIAIRHNKCRTFALSFLLAGYRNEYAATLLPSFVNLPSAISQYNLNQNVKSYLNNSIIFE